jgi:hypothetical protein
MVARNEPGMFAHVLRIEGNVNYVLEIIILKKLFILK